MTHPAIADAAAVAVPSVEWGEAVGIAVVTRPGHRSEEHTSELQSLMRNSSAVFCLKKTKTDQPHTRTNTNNYYLPTHIPTANDLVTVKTTSLRDTICVKIF